MSASPGNCKIITRAQGVGGVKSLTRNPNAPIEKGRTILDLTTLGSVSSC